MCHFSENTYSCVLAISKNLCMAKTFIDWTINVSISSLHCCSNMRKNLESNVYKGRMCFPDCTLPKFDTHETNDYFQNIYLFSKIEQFAQNHLPFGVVDILRHSKWNHFIKHFGFSQKIIGDPVSGCWQMHHNSGDGNRCGGCMLCRRTDLRAGLPIASPTVRRR